MPFNSVYNKKDFLDWVAKQIPNDCVVYITTHFNEVEYVKKTDSKNIKFQFPAFGFERRDGVKDVYEAIKFSTLIMEREHFKEGLLDVVDGKSEEYRNPLPAPKVKAKIK